MERCCANCEWHISPELEDEILKEQSCYTEDSLNRPMAGDCVLGNIPNRNFYCHDYLCCDGNEETYALCDVKYAGTGFLIIHTVADEVDKFFKISSCDQSSLPYFLICACAKNIKDSSNKFRTINFKIDKDNELFLAFNSLAENLNNKKLYSYDGAFKNKDNIQFISSTDSVVINFNKDILGVKTITDFTNISLVYNDNCKFYNILSEFYNSLSKLAINTSTDEDIKMLKLTK